MMSEPYEISKKIPAYMQRLKHMYASDAHNIYYQIISNASVFVREQVSYDNWNGGTTGHALIFFLEEDILRRIDNFDIQEEICEKLKKEILINVCDHRCTNV